MTFREFLLNEKVVMYGLSHKSTKPKAINPAKPIPPVFSGIVAPSLNIKVPKGIMGK